MTQPASLVEIYIDPKTGAVTEVRWATDHDNAPFGQTRLPIVGSVVRLTHWTIAHHRA